MEFKTSLQLFLFSIIILISLLFLKTYFFESKDGEQKVLLPQEEKINDTSSSTIESIGFISEDRNWNKYTIKSEFADLNNDQSNLIIMKNVRATVNLKNSNPIIVNSKNAHYNNITFDTSFFDEVTMKYNYHIIKSDNLNLNFKKNLVTISGNVIYNDLNTVMETDKIEIDLITKNSKIFMNDKKKLVKIKNMN